MGACEYSNKPYSSTWQGLWLPEQFIIFSGRTLLHRVSLLLSGHHLFVHVHQMLQKPKTKNNLLLYMPKKTVVGLPENEDYNLKCHTKNTMSFTFQAAIMCMESQYSKSLAHYYIDSGNITQFTTAMGSNCDTISKTAMTTGHYIHLPCKWRSVANGFTAKCKKW